MKYLISILLFLTCSTSWSQEDGTLIFLENSKWIVEKYTDSPVCHAAVIMSEDGVKYVYEAEPPRVHRIEWEEYKQIIARINYGKDKADQVKMFLLSPKETFTKSEIKNMKNFADGEIGRDYSISNVIWQQKDSGTNCAQLSASILNKSNRFDIDKPYAIYPVSLKELVASKYNENKISVKLNKPIEEKKWHQRASVWCSESYTFSCWACHEVWKNVW